MILAAESLRQEVLKGNGAKILHYIADETALQNDFISTEQAYARADEIAQTVRGITDRLGISDNYIILRGSEISSDPVRQYYLEKTTAYANENVDNDAYKGYVAEQCADMAYLSHVYNGRVKVSWTMARSPESANKGLDETFFDNHFKKCFPDFDMQFAYIRPGARLHNQANRACPYTMAENEPRFSLTDSKTIEDVLNDSQCEAKSRTGKETIKYFNEIANGVEQLVGKKFAEPAQKHERINAVKLYCNHI
jgi:hypothetical protein